MLLAFVHGGVVDADIVSAEDSACSTTMKIQSGLDNNCVRPCHLRLRTYTSIPYSTDYLASRGRRA